MNTRLPILALCLFMAFGLSNCKKDPVEEPIEYNFDDDFKDITVEVVTETEPAAVASTEASVSNSAATEAAAQALASGTETTEITAASSAAASILTEDEATNLSAALEADGELTAAQQAELNALIASSSFAAFLPTSVAPTVDGTTVSARKSSNANAVTVLNLTEMLLGVSDACTDAATSAYANSKISLDAAKASQEAKINTTFATRQTAITAEHTAALAAIATKWTTAKTQALASRNALLAIVTKPYHRVIVHIIYRMTLASINASEALDIKAAGTLRDKKVANATAAKNTDLAVALANYNTALNTAKSKAASVGATCHNQGGSI